MAETSYIKILIDGLFAEWLLKDMDPEFRALGEKAAERFIEAAKQIEQPVEVTLP